MRDFAVVWYNLSAMKMQILPSLLAADFGRLADEILRAEASGAEALHLDIMDAHFVPNLSFGPDVVALAKRVAPGFCRNVHLMMSRPDLYLEKFAKAGAETIQIHVEADCDIHHELRRIRELGLRNALVFNPETPFERMVPYLGEVDEVLAMTVHPGYGGQSFIAECLPKIAALRANLNYTAAPFTVADDVKAYCAACVAESKAAADHTTHTGAGRAFLKLPTNPPRRGGYDSAKLLHETRLLFGYLFVLGLFRFLGLNGFSVDLNDLHAVLHLLIHIIYLLNIFD